MDRKETFKLQKEINAGIKKAKTDLPRKELFALQKVIKQNLAKLGKIVKKDQPKVNTPVFDALVKGDYDDLEVLDYIAKVKAAHVEIDELKPLEVPAERYIKNHSDEIGEKFQQELSDAIGEAKTEVDNDDDDGDDEEDPKEAKKKDKSEDEKKEKLEDSDNDDDDQEDEKVGESVTKLSKRKIKNSDKAFFAGTYGKMKIAKVFDHEYFIIGESFEDKSRFYPCQLKEGKIERVLGDEALLTLEDAKARFIDFIGESKETDSVDTKSVASDESLDEIGEANDDQGIGSENIPVVSTVEVEEEEEEDDETEI